MKELYQEEIDELTEKLIEAIAFIVDDKEWLNAVYNLDDKQNKALELLTDIVLWYSAGFAVNYDLYDPKAIHPLLDKSLLEQAINSIMCCSAV